MLGELQCKVALNVEVSHPPVRSTTFGCLKPFMTIASYIKEVMVSMSTSSVKDKTESKHNSTGLCTALKIFN